MAQNPLLQLHEVGQSVWLDYIDRTLLASGELGRLVGQGEVQGVTSNPTIFQKAIQTCADYDATIRARSNDDTVAIY
ncbi:MAG TPA: transaldolase family protein, partial [Anaerolineae bacterium]|nr:transaldolase family protein [Anaerolineae bacterium]